MFKEQQWTRVRTRQGIESFLSKSDCIIIRYINGPCYLFEDGPIFLKGSEIKNQWSFDMDGNLIGEYWIFPIPPFDGGERC